MIKFCNVPLIQTGKSQQTSTYVNNVIQHILKEKSGKLEL